MGTHPFRRVCVAVLGALTLSAGLLAGSMGTAQARLASGATMCVPGSAAGSAVPRGEYVKAGGPTELTGRQVTRMERRTQQVVAGSNLQTAARRPSARNPVVVPVAVHTIKPRQRARNQVRMGKARQAIRILNRGFAGREADNAFATSFRFRLASYDVTVDQPGYRTWFGTRAERRMKRALKVGGQATLNLYFTKPRNGGLGWSYYPQTREARTKLDGVVINHETNRGGAATGYNRGDTLTHEVGHWLGLFHTFQGGCNRLNDRVGDTAPQAFPNYGCPEGLDTCTKDSRDDPIHNFMDYSLDRCLNKFTRGQNERMRLHYLAYRA